MAIEYEKIIWMEKNTDGTIPEGAPAMNAKNLNRIEDCLEKLVGQVNRNTNGVKNNSDYINNLGYSTLWTNETPDALFEAQTVEVDMSKYCRVVILIRTVNTSDVYCEHSIYDKGYKIFLNTGRVGGVDYDTGRCVLVSDEGITFYNGQREGSTGAPSKNYNQYAIPIKIIGYTY